MRKKHVRVVSLGCLIALSANSLTVLAQGTVQPRKTQDPAVWVTTTDGARHIEGGTFDFIVADDQAHAGGISVVTPQGGPMTFFASEMSFDVHVVKGTPFSAVAVTETTQTLSDGNRIVRRTSSNIFRDGEGRTRREQTLATVGPFTASDGSAQRVFINDPVTGVNYVLDPRAQTAQKNPMPQVRMMTATAAGGGSGAGVGVGASSATSTTVVAGTNLKVATGGVAGMAGMAVKRQQPEYPPVAKAAGAQGTVEVQVTVDENGQVTDATAINGHPLLRQAAIDAAKQWQFKTTEVAGKPSKVQGTITFNFVLDKGASANTAMAEKVATTVQRDVTFERTPFTFTAGEKVDLKTESLGKRTFDGVEADGTRTVSTIPAGAIGNERPIEIVSERWYSAALQTVVMTRHSDPRTGENVYRLENINRTEPAANMFQVPSDYTVSEPMNMMRKKREAQQQN
jgi:TonB family protein